MTPRHRTELVNLALEAQAENARQDRAGYNPSPAIDSAIEHALWLAKHAKSDLHRHHVAELLRHLTVMLESNRAEREHERQIAGRVDRSGEWSFRRVVRESRDPLAVLANPIIKGRPRADALAFVRRITAEAPPEIVGTLAKPSVRMREELGVNRYTLLLVIAAGRVTA